MRRGDVITVAAAGDFGKPRPAVIVQTDALPENDASVVICQLTSEVVDAADFRVTVAPTSENGLRVPSQVMADKPVTVRRTRVGRHIGRLSADAWRIGIFAQARKHVRTAGVEEDSRTTSAANAFNETVTDPGAGRQGSLLITSLCKP